MTSEEIAKRILDKYNSTIPFSADFSSGKLSVKSVPKKLWFDITEEKPLNTDDVLDWFLLDENQIIEVMKIILKDTDIEIIKNRITKFLEDKKLITSKCLYLVPYLDDV